MLYPDLTWRRIQYKDEVYTPEHKMFPWLKNLALTSAFTLMTMREHFLYSHLLVVGTVWNVTMTALPETHWLRQLIYPHGYQINEVNVYKGIPLVNQCFKLDWFCTAEGFGQLVQEWIRAFDIYQMAPTARLETLRTMDEIRTTRHLMRESKHNHEHESKLKIDRQLLDVSPFWNKMLRYWQIFNRYVSQCLEGEEMQLDDHVTEWYQKLSSIPYLRNLKPLDKGSLQELLSIYLFVSIVYHKSVADNTEDISSLADLFIPTDRIGHANSQFSKQFFKFILKVGTEPEELLSSIKWLSNLPPAFLPFAKQLQQECLSLGQELELGINK